MKINKMVLGRIKTLGLAFIRFDLTIQKLRTYLYLLFSRKTVAF